MSSGQSQLPIKDNPKGTVTGKVDASNGKDNSSELKWNQVFPAKVKNVIWIIKENSSKIYESTPPKTMKYLALISSLILFFAVLSLVLAQRDETQQSKYGMAFPIEEAAGQTEKRVASLEGVPGETDASDSKEDITTTLPSVSSEESKVTVVPESDDKKEDNETPVSPVLVSEEDEKSEEGDRNPRIVFIERLMGLHLSAPARQPDGSNGESNDKEQSGEQEPNNARNAFEKVNAKWASRMRKFSIPIPSSTDSHQGPAMPEQPNPMLRYAAAAMMSRLVAAAARAQMEAQAREALNNHIARGGKDKDEDSDDETVPVIVATMRDERAPVPQFRPIPPMYGRPMPRAPVMRPPVMPFAGHQHPRQMPSLSSMPQRSYIAPPPQQPQPQPQIQARQPVGPISIQRRGSSNSNVQPVLVMLAVPIQSSESRQSQASVYPTLAHSSNAIHYPIHNQRSQMPFYPTVPYTIPFTRPHYQPSSSYAVPVHIPIPVPTPFYQRPVYHYPVQRQMASYAHIRPVIEVPVEVPVPYHVPVQVPVSVRSGHGMTQDHETAPSDQDHIVLLYDAELHHGENEDLDHSASESHNMHSNQALKSLPFLTRPLPHINSPSKMKLWRELANTKHATQPGVRFLPVAISSEESQHQAPVNHYGPLTAAPQANAREQAAESAHQPAFIVLAEQQEH